MASCGSVPPIGAGTFFNLASATSGRRQAIVGLGTGRGTHPDASGLVWAQHDAMTTHKPIQFPSAPDASEPLSSAEKLEKDALLAGAAAAGTVRAVDLAAIVLIGFLVVPPLAILALLVVVPVLVTALVLGLLAAVISAPYLLFHHFHGDHGGHMSLLAHRVRVAIRALIDLAPHRIVADVRRAAAGR